MIRAINLIRMDLVAFIICNVKGKVYSCTPFSSLHPSPEVVKNYKFVIIFLLCFLSCLEINHDLN